MTDIVERLRKAGLKNGFAVILKQHVDQAADEIARLRADAVQAEWRVVELHELAYAPDGRTQRTLLFEEAAKRGQAERERDDAFEEIERLREKVNRLQRDTLFLRDQ